MQDPPPPRLLPLTKLVSPHRRAIDAAQPAGTSGQQVEIVPRRRTSARMAASSSLQSGQIRRAAYQATGCIQESERHCDDANGKTRSEESITVTIPTATSCASSRPTSTPLFFMTLREALTRGYAPARRVLRPVRHRRTRAATARHALGIPMPRCSPIWPQLTPASRPLTTRWFCARGQ